MNKRGAEIQTESRVPVQLAERRRGELSRDDDQSLSAVLASMYMPLELRGPRRQTGAAFDVARLRCADLTILQSRSDPWRARRDPSDDEQDETVAVALVTAGRIGYTNGPESVLLAPGDVGIWDGRRRADIETFPATSKFAIVAPRSRFCELDHAAPRPARFDSPGTRLLLGHVRNLTRELPYMGAVEQSLAADATIALLRLALWPARAADASTLRDVLLPKVRSWIGAHLLDPDMSPARIARVHAVSLRTLHAIFEPTGESVSRFVRRRRLEAAHRLLVIAPGMSVADAAQHCGFRSPAHFTRAFRERFGQTPSDVRRAPS